MTPGYRTDPSSGLVFQGSHPWFCSGVLQLQCPASLSTTGVEESLGFSWIILPTGSLDPELRGRASRQRQGLDAFHPCIASELILKPWLTGVGHSWHGPAEGAGFLTSFCEKKKIEKKKDMT